MTAPALALLAVVGDPASYVIHFLLISLVVAVVTAAIRLDRSREIRREAARFFATIVVGIALFSALVYAVEWIFVRRL